MKKLLSTLLFLSFLSSLVVANFKKELDISYSRKQYDEVIEKATPYLNVDSTKTEASLFIGRSYADKKEYSKALPYLLYVAENDTSWSKWRKSWALDYLGRTYFMLGEYDKSKKSLEACIELAGTKNSVADAKSLFKCFAYDLDLATWKKVETEHFVFYFQNMTEDKIEKITTSEENAFITINGFFKAPLPKKIDYFVWKTKPSSKELIKELKKRSIENFYVIHSRENQTPGYLITKTISYNAVDIKKKHDLIFEGTAKHFHQKVEDKYIPIKDWMLLNKDTICIKHLWINHREYPKKISRYVGALFVKCLIDEYGRDKFLEFFKEQTYEHGLKVYGQELDRVIADVENKINANYPKATLPLKKDTINSMVPINKGFSQYKISYFKYMNGDYIEVENFSYPYIVIMDTAYRIVEKYTISKGKLDYNQKYVYNEKGKKVSSTYVNQKLNFTSTSNYEYIYNSVGQIDSTLIKTTNKNGEPIIRKEVYAYNENGDLLSKKTYNKDELVAQSEYQTNKENNTKTEVKKQIFRKEVQKQTITVYNEKELEVSKKSFSLKDSNDPVNQYSYEYVYDKKGNWIIKKEFINGKLEGEQRRIPIVQ
ncbi:MAG: hypothetical protein JW922_03510 [Paludibacteraceae bacterium]|nr:hypothetical protein [Paludibacteraceae bacterium]